MRIRARNFPQDIVTNEKKRYQGARLRALNEPVGLNKPLEILDRLTELQIKALS